jgi:acetylornithine deacetylase/succinyl-diaminopimelate desuccinylase family protein
MLEKKVCEKIDGIEILELLSDLVNIPSYDSEQRVVEYIAGRLQKIGVEYEITQVAPARQNLIASAGEGEKSLIFNTHTDTVPPGNMENWKYPPLKLTRDGKDLFGLGSCDAKGSLTSMLAAFEALACYASSLNGRLILQAVCCEETRARGTLAEVRRGVSADAAIVGEPTELIPRIGHKGGLGLEVTVYGKAAHGSAPQEGINAISGMAGLIRSLDVLAEDISKRSDPIFGSPSLAVTKISGGQAANVIPDKCVVTIDRRLIPGETIDDALNEVSAVVDEEKNSSSLMASIKKAIGIEPCRTSLEEPIVKAVKDSISQVRGIDQEFSGFTACCDMWCLTRGAGIPAVILGPGKLSMAHKANEYVSLDELYLAARIYAAIALNWFS